jgi:predicted kinase
MTCTPCQTCRMTRTVVLVNGLPAAGKSTLAPQLAAELGLPLFTMDVIKEAHADVLGADPPNGLTQREWNRHLGKAAAATMWALLNQSTPGAVLESSWRRDVRHLVEAGLRSVGLSGVAEVWCDAPAHVLRQRFSRRWELSHAIHGAEPSDQEWAQMLEQGEPLALGPVLRVDTTTQVDITAVAAWCRANACTTEKMN